VHDLEKGLDHQGSHQLLQEARHHSVVAQPVAGIGECGGVEDRS
jgi:hypothetical protein